MNERSIFLEALERDDPTQRSAYLDTACAGNAALRQRVEALLESHATAGNFLGKLAPERLAEELELPQTIGEMQGETPETDVVTGDELCFLASADKPGVLGRLAHYEILEVIGKGGMGIVLRAFDEKLHRIVAIKVMAAPLATNATARQRFTREAQAQAAVSHDHIVTIHAVEGDCPQPYLVMQYVPGLSLQQRLDRDGPLALNEILRIGMQTASGLAAAHAQGLVHRDIKPANILLENGVERVKITDFGLARVANEASLTQSSVIAGTPQYMSPEQAEGQAIDPRTDLFSLGSVLYAMCTGRAPFRASGTLAVLKRVCEDTPTPIRETNPEIPDWLVAIIARLHAKDPAHRFQSATEVADLLSRHLAQVQHPSAVPLPAESASLAPSGNGVRSERRGGGRRHRWAVAAAVLLLLLGSLSLSEAIGVTNLRGTVVRILTPDGTLVVETEDPGVKVTIEGDGGLVITGAGPHEVRLRPGSYKLQAAKDGKMVRLDRELVSITRGDTQVVRVRLEGEAPVVSEYPLTGSFTASVKLPGAKDPIVRQYTIHERFAVGADNLRAGPIQRAYPWGQLRVEANSGPDGKLVLKRLLVSVEEDWDGVRGESLGFSTVKADLIEPRRLPAMRLTTAAGDLPLFFDESQGLDSAVIKVTGALKLESVGVEPGAAPAAFDPPWSDSDDWVVEGQELVQPNDRGANLVFGDPNWTDYDFEAEFKIIAGGSEVGLDFRATSRVDGLYAVVGAFGNTCHGVFAHSEKGATAIGLVKGQSKKGRWYRLCIEARGERVQMFLDGNLLTTVDAGQRLRGCVGFLTNGCSARFRNVKVTDPSGKVLLEGVQGILPKAKETRAPTSKGEPPTSPQPGALSAFLLGEFYAQSGRWDKAVAAYRRGLELNPKDYGDFGEYGVWYRVALLQVQLGEKEGWHSACREMLDRFGKTSDPEIAHRTARACLLAPKSVASIETIMKLADRSLVGTEKDRNYRDFQMVKCLAEYRAGRYDSAVKGLRALSPTTRGDSVDAICFAGLALAEHRLGRAAQARTALDKCRVILKERMPDPAKGRPFGGDWYNWLHGQIIYREAEQVTHQGSGVEKQKSGTKPD